MFKCPHCKSEIDHVIAFSECWQNAPIDENGMLANEPWDSVEEIGDLISTECPECNMTLDSQ